MVRGHVVHTNRVFAIELRSRRALKNASLSDETGGSVLIEGTLGALTSASFSEGVVLEISGTKGTLRVDLHPEEIETKPDQSHQALHGRARSHS